MPEGPEVRRHADAVGRALEKRPIVAVDARTRAARAWLEAHPDALVGRRVQSVRSHGKNLIVRVAGGYFFHSHLMMWGRWEVFDGGVPYEKDKRERARIVVPDGAAVLFSAPVFEIGRGDPYVEVEHLASLGPDVLPYGKKRFDRAEFVRRLFEPDHLDRTIGAALLDQRILAGVGNYLRAEILFECRIDPWRRVGDLTKTEISCLGTTIPAVSRLAYETGGVTVSPERQARMREDADLVYSLGRDWGTRHSVFRRTNLPCLECGDVVRQMRQTTYADEENERTRIIYFCPTCQGTSVELKKPRRRRAPATPPADEFSRTAN